MVQTIHLSQHYIKTNEAFWSVSLRDVARFKLLFIYFWQNNSLKPGKYFDHEKFRSILYLTLAFCYIFRLSSREKREIYKSQVRNIL